MVKQVLTDLTDAINRHVTKTIEQRSFIKRLITRAKTMAASSSLNVLLSSTAFTINPNLQPQELLKLPLDGEFKFNIYAPYIVLRMTIKRCMVVIKTATSITGGLNEAFELSCSAKWSERLDLTPVFDLSVKSSSSTLYRVGSWERKKTYTLGVYAHLKDLSAKEYSSTVTFKISCHNFDSIAADQQRQILGLLNEIKRLSMR